MANICSLPATPDVFGAGVRLAVYLHTLLCLIPQVLFALNKRTLLDNLDLSERLTTINIILAFSILASSLFQVLGTGMSSYHAHVALKLSGLNISNLLVFYWMLANYNAIRVHKRSRNPLELLDGELVEARSGRQANSTFSKRMLVLAGGVFMSLVGLFGIWLWQEPECFGPQNTRCATDAVVVVMPLLGNLRVALSSRSLRACYLVLYGVFLAVVVPSLIVETLSPGCLFSSTSLGRRSTPKYLKMLFVLNLATILEIESTLRENAHLQAEEMNVWGFGQILAAVTVMMPARDIFRAISAARIKTANALKDGDASMLPINSMEKIGSPNSAGKEVWAGDA